MVVLVANVPRPPVNRCPKCKGNFMYRDYNNDQTCIYCGFIHYRYEPKKSFLRNPKQENG